MSVIPHYGTVPCVACGRPTRSTCYDSGITQYTDEPVGRVGAWNEHDPDGDDYCLLTPEQHGAQVAAWRKARAEAEEGRGWSRAATVG